MAVIAQVFHTKPDSPLTVLLSHSRNSSLESSVITLAKIWNRRCNSTIITNNYIMLSISPVDWAQAGAPTAACWVLSSSLHVSSKL